MLGSYKGTTNNGELKKGQNFSIYSIQKGEWGLEVILRLLVLP
jgi:hypothetical protein